MGNIRSPFLEFHEPINPSGLGAGGRESVGSPAEPNDSAGANHWLRTGSCPDSGGPGAAD